MLATSSLMTKGVCLCSLQAACGEYTVRAVKRAAWRLKTRVRFYIKVLAPSLSLTIACPVVTQNEYHKSYCKDIFEHLFDLRSRSGQQVTLRASARSLELAADLGHNYRQYRALL